MPADGGAEPSTRKPLVDETTHSRDYTGKSTGQTTMENRAFQDYYPPELSYCYGCGSLNPHGLHVKSYWDGDESVCVFTPRPFHTAVPGYVYGGLLASLIDCHGTGTASAAAYRAEGRPMDSDPPLRYLTASLSVDYLRPTPLGPPLEVRGRVVEIKGRKVVVSSTVSADGEVCVTGQVVAVRIPEQLWTEIQRQHSSASAEGRDGI